MKITYKIREDDWLEVQLFAASQSKKIRKFQRNGTVMFVVLALLCGVYFYMKDSGVFPLIFWGAIAVAGGLLFPRYSKWRYKTYYRKYVRETIGKMAGDTIEVEINSEIIRSVEPSSETVVKLSDIDNVTETRRLFIVKNKSAAMLAIPRDSVENTDNFKDYLRSLGLDVKDYLDWKW